MKKARTWADIQADPRVQWVSDERNDNGYWVYLHRPYVDAAREMTCIHEDTIRECCDILNNDISANPDLFDSLLGL
jgi:hypothetical protein